MSNKKLEPTVRRDLLVRDTLKVLESQLQDAKNAVNAAVRALQYLKAQL